MQLTASSLIHSRRYTSVVTRLAAALWFVAVGMVLFACTDDVPALQSESVPQQQAVQEPEDADDSLCSLLNPLINRRSITEPRVSYGDVVDAIEQGATINIRCAGGTSPLHFSAATHGLQVVELLIDQGADVDAVNSAGETPLIYAVGAIGGSDTNAAILRALLRAGADVNAAREFGQTTLHIAALNSKPNAMAALLEFDPLPNALDNGGRTPLHYAALQSASTEPARLLLAAGADPNATAEDGSTPLHDAVVYASVDVVRLLLEAGAAPNPLDEVGITPLLRAAREGGASLIRVLLEHGADPDAVDPDGRTPLHVSARHNPLSAVSALLLDAGADPALRDQHGNTVCDVLNDYLSDPEVRQRICKDG